MMHSKTSDHSLAQSHEATQTELANLHIAADMLHLIFSGLCELATAHFGLSCQLSVHEAEIRSELSLLCELVELLNDEEYSQSPTLLRQRVATLINEISHKLDDLTLCTYEKKHASAIMQYVFDS